MDGSQLRRQTTSEREVSRLLAKQINTGKEDVFFAATLPLETLRKLSPTTVTGDERLVLMSDDTARAHIHARTSSVINVEKCEEDKTEPGDEHRCGKLK